MKVCLGERAQGGCLPERYSLRTQNGARKYAGRGGVASYAAPVCPVAPLPHHFSRILNRD